jgi:hypothetical protein
MTTTKTLARGVRDNAEYRPMIRNLPGESACGSDCGMRDHALAVPDVFVGRVNLTTIRTGEVFLDAVRRHSPGIILVHNHPLRGPCTER